MKTLKIALIAVALPLTFVQCNKEGRCKGEVCSYTLSGNETPGEITQAEGSYSFAYTVENAGGDFSGGMGADFYIGDENQLVVSADGRCVTIENPIKVSSSEVSFKDNCEYHCTFRVKRSGSELVSVTVLNSAGEVKGVFK